MEKPQAQAGAGFHCPQELGHRPQDMELGGAAGALGPSGPLLVCLCFGTLAAQAADTCPGEMDLFPAPECWSSPLTDHR